jgi:Carboxypeptidase regulatory-like domain/TonB dependent receptor/TonB-dependent Receptor Plug Domain
MRSQLLARVILFAFVCAALGVHSAHAQSVYASLVGNVVDTTGAALPGATVVATQTETNLRREVVTNASGAYSIPNIPSGTYSIVVTMAGFQTFTTKDVIVTNREVRVDARLSVGALEESVTVSGTAAILQTENAAVQHIATSEQLQTVPTSGRAFASFLTLMPGVTAQPDYSQSGGINNPARAMTVTTNGVSSNDTVTRLDGASITNQYFGSIPDYSPGIEALESIKVLTSSFDADSGLAGGATVNLQVKSGTNSVHGSMFDYDNDSRLRSRNFFLPAGQTKGESTYNIFGGTLGGPIFKNKFFYFISEEGVRQRSINGNPVGQTQTSGFISLPPADLRRGDFSGTGTVIYDPATGAANGTGRIPFAFENCPGLSSTTDAAFAGCNYIPQNRINPISAAMMQALVMPTLSGYTSNYYVTPMYNSTYHKVDAKLTYTPTSKLTVNGRIGWLPSWERSGAAFPFRKADGTVADADTYNPLAQGRVWHSRINSDSIGATAILSKSFVVDGVFSFTKHNVGVFPPEHQCSGDYFNIPHACQPPNSLDTAVPNFNFGTNSWTINSTSPVRHYVDPQEGWVANAGWTKGSHNVKFGFEYDNLHQNHYETQVQDFTFNGGLTSLSGGQAANNFNRFADFLLGLPMARSSQASTPLLGQTTAGAVSDITNTWFPVTLIQHNIGTYIGDRWDITPSFTASVGLRWEYYSLPAREDHGIEVFDFTQNKLLICGVGQAVGNSYCNVPVQKDLLTPRIGLAYRLNDKTVVRAGFSRNPQNDNPGRQQLPPSQAFPQTVIITQTAPNNFSAIGNLSEGSPVVPIVDLTSGIVTLPAGAGVNTFRGAFDRGTISSWNISAQRALSTTSSINVSYVANRQNNLVRLQNLNYGQLGGGAASQPFQPIGITSAMNVQSNLGHVVYDSAQVSYNRRMTHGLQITAAYTYSKTIDWWSGSIPIPQYWNLNKGQTGRPNVFNASAIYELPFGSGRKWLNGGGPLGNIVGGWQLNGFFSYFQGTLVGVTSNSNALNAPGTTTQFADKIKDGPVEIFGDACATCQYFDVSAFKSVTDLRFGNSGLTAFRGPSSPNVDMSFFRTFKMGGNSTLQLRAECFNVTNTAHFANPNTNVSNVTYNADGSIRALNGTGAITGTTRLGRQYDEREWRLGLRYGF